MANKATKRRKPPRKKPDKTRILSRLIVTAGVVFCLVFSFFTLRPVLREYYIASREHERLLLEYEAVLARNTQIEGRIDNLDTAEGIEDRAREQFGWVRAGEEAVNVTGLNTSESSTALPATVTANSIVVESTWWTDFLDLIFGVEQSEAEQEMYDPFIG